MSIESQIVITPRIESTSVKPELSLLLQQNQDFEYLILVVYSIRIQIVINRFINCQLNDELDPTSSLSLARNQTTNSTTTNPSASFITFNDVLTAIDLHTYRKYLNVFYQLQTTAILISSP